jgi:amidase
MTDQAFSFMEATVDSFHQFLRAGGVTSSKLTAWYLQRIESHNRQGAEIQAIVNVNPRAAEEAALLDDYYAEHGEFVGPLHGVPVLVKDQAETKGIPTTFGSIIFKDYIPAEDAEIIKRLRKAGAVILAKTSMCDFAAGWFSFSSVTGHTKNPYALDREAGGSSAGTSAGIASNFGLLGIGEDTGGSIRLPSSFNNLFGLRVTTGLISRSGFSPLVHFQDTPGPIARTVRDLAKLLDVIVGYDGKDAFTAAAASTVNAGRYESGLELTDKAAVYRVGILENAFGPDTEADSKVVNDVVRSTIGQLSSDDRVEITGGIELSDLPQWVKDTSLYTVQSKQDIGNFLAQRDNAPMKSFMEIYESNAFHPLNDLFHDIANGPEDPEDDADYYRKRTRQEEFRRRVVNLMAQHNVDFLLYPVVQVLPPTRVELEAQKWTCLTFPTNTVIASQTGLPSLSIPAGFTDARIPVGFELIGKPHSESSLLQFAYDYEQKVNPRIAPILL